MTDTAPQLPTPTLMLVTDRFRHSAGVPLDSLVQRVGQAVQGGVQAVQLREKDLDREQLLALALRVKDAIAGRALLIINTALDVAQEVGADGVHLPEQAPPLAKRARGLLFGRSVHSVASARRAIDEGVDYLIAGPVFKSSSHLNPAPAGLSLLLDIVSISPVPVIAIGGIGPSRIGRVIHVGASGVAAITSILTATDPAEMAKRMREKLESEFARRRALE